MKNTSPPKIDQHLDISNFRESHKEEITQLALMLKKRGKDLGIQLALADEARAEQVGSNVTFVTNQNINFTDNCIGTCKFCSFKSESKKDLSLSRRMSLGDIEIETQKALARGCTEVCIQGGLDPQINYAYYIDLLKTIKRTAPNIHIHAFSPAEIAYMSQLSGENIEDIFKELKKNGLGSFPGTAAEILVDEVRKVICPDKISTEQWVNIVLTGHRVGLKSSATMMYGHIESLIDEAEHLVLLKKIQEVSEGFTEFVPLSFMHQNTILYRFLGARPSSSGMHDLALYSAARLYLGESICNLQTSWVKLGRKLAQISLDAGVNDLGGTLFTENITKKAGGTYGELMTVEDFVAIIKDANRIPVERDTLYNLINHF